MAEIIHKIKGKLGKGVDEREGEKYPGDCHNQGFMEKIKDKISMYREERKKRKTNKKEKKDKKGENTKYESSSSSDNDTD